MNKKERIKELNSKTLFHSRKNFGMFGDLQWIVEDIKDDTLIVRVSSSTTGWGGVQPDGRQLPTKKKIAENIKESILRDLPDAKVEVNWVKWKPEHGKGFIMSVHGKTAEEAADEVWNKLHGEDVRKLVIPCKQCGKIAAIVELISSALSKDKRTTICVHGFVGETTAYGLGSKDISDKTLDEIQALADTNLKNLHLLDQDVFGFICRECQAAYCSNCWSNMIERFDEGFFDDIRATCLKGHEQMIKD